MRWFDWARSLSLWWWLLVPVLAAPQTEAARTHFNRGVALQQQGDLEGARRAYEQSLQLAPHQVDALANLGLVYLHLGYHEEAIDSFRKALVLQPQLTHVRLFLGLARFRFGQFEAAERELAVVLKAQPNHPQALHLAGLCLLKLDQLPEGIAALEAALQANPGNLDAAYTLATAYVGSGEIEKAEALLAGPLRHQNSAEAHLVRGSLLNAKREAKAALLELTKAKELQEKLPTLRVQLGYAHLLLVEYEQAASEFLTALQQNPDDFHANAYLGWLYIQEKRYPEAAARLTAALRQKPDNNAILYQLGQIYQVSGESEKAALVLEQVVKQQPDFIPAHVLLAKAYTRLKRMEDFAREQAIVRQLNDKEQEKNLGERARERDVTLIEFSAGLLSKPVHTRKEP